METNKKPKNPSAFPVPTDRWDEGMTLRDYFANSAMQGLLSNSTVSTTVGIGYEDNNLDLAKCCYSIADAMLKQREL